MFSSCSKSDPQASEFFPLYEQLDSHLSAVEIFQRLASLPSVLFLDSALKHQHIGRYSFIMADPFKTLTVPSDQSDALGFLEKILAQYPTTTLPSLPPFQGGAAGLWGYELGRSLEKTAASSYDEFKIPALDIGLYDVVLAVDHHTETTWIISQGFPETAPEARRKNAFNRLESFKNFLCHKKPFRTIQNQSALDAKNITPLSRSELAPQFATSYNKKLTSNFSPAGFRKAIQQAIDYIYAGDVFQVNIAQRLLYPAEEKSLELYLRLRKCNAAPFAGYFAGRGYEILSASPERFVSVNKRQVETRPIKGTTGRVLHPEADLFAGDLLKASEKDRAENIMIVDLLRNDLSRVCEPTSVQVTQLCQLETYAYVQHLVSIIQGKLLENRGPIDLLRASFPGGSITGAPKIRAMQIIAEIEPTVRGAYCGSLGYLGFDGQLDTSILIRTITAARGWWQIQVGGGIVAQSTPETEYEETWLKAVGMLKALITENKPK